MAKSKAGHVSAGRVLFHFILGCLTGGIWWCFLGIRYLLR